MSRPRNFDLPLFKGTDLFPQVTQQPPITRLHAVASDKWVAANIDTVAKLANEMVQKNYSWLMHFINGARQNHHIGSTNYTSVEDNNGPYVRCTYIHNLGLEFIDIYVYPESYKKGSKLKIPTPPDTWPIGYKEAGDPDYSVMLGEDGTNPDFRIEGTAVYFQPLTGKKYWEYYLKDYERPERCHSGWEGNCTDPPTRGWQGWERFPRFGIIPNDGVWADKTDRSFGYAWDDLFEDWGLGGPTPADQATDADIRVHTTFYMVGNFFFQDTPGEGQPDPEWPDNVGQADVGVYREFFFPPDPGTETTTTIQTGGGWVCQISSIDPAVASAGFNKSVGDTLPYTFSYSASDPNGTAPVLSFNYPIYWDNNSPHTTPPRTYRTQQTFRVGADRYLDSVSDVFYQTDAFSVSHVVTGMNFGAFNPDSTPEPSRADYLAWKAWATANFIGEIAVDFVFTTPTTSTVTTVTGTDYTTGTPTFMDNAWHAPVCWGSSELAQVTETVYRITKYAGIDLIEKWRPEDKQGDKVVERGTVFMFAFDADTGKLYVGVDGKWHDGSMLTSDFKQAKAIDVNPSADWFPACSYATYYTAVDMLFSSAQNYEPPSKYTRLGDTEGVGDIEIDLP